MKKENHKMVKSVCLATALALVASIAFFALPKSGAGQEPMAVPSKNMASYEPAVSYPVEVKGTDGDIPLELLQQLSVLADLN